MLAALVVMSLAYRVAAGRSAPLFAEKFQVSTRRDITSRLVGGAALFGIGWGLVGLCPGPAISGLGLGLPQIAQFVLAMLAGMAIHRFLFSKTGSH